MSEKISINFLRHGETDYVEDGKKDRGEDLSVRESDLTELGVEQVKATAEQLANEINPDKEEVILWSSPNWRAQGSEDIIEATLKERGIPILKQKVSPTLRATRGKHNYEEESKAVEANAFRFIKWASSIAKKYKGEKQVRVISVSHYEFLTPIMQGIFNFDIHNGEGYKKAELMNLSFRYDKELDQVFINAKMRDREVDNIYLDYETKTFKTA